MKIYCVRSWITTTKTRKGRSTIDNSDQKQFYYMKLKSARAAFNNMVNEINADLSCSYRGQSRQGRVKLFIPHVSDTGMLMYWPDGNYIAEYDKSDQGKCLS